jgi:hypothetical protein
MELFAKLSIPIIGESLTSGNLVIIIVDIRAQVQYNINMQNTHRKAFI